MKKGRHIHSKQLPTTVYYNSSSAVSVGLDITRENSVYICNVELEDYSGLMGYQVDINYNADLLQLVEINFQHTLGNNDSDTYRIQPKISSGKLASLAEVRLSDKGISGSGIVLQLKFSQKNVMENISKADFSISNIKLANENAEPISYIINPATMSTSIIINQFDNLSMDYSISNSYPNPFNSETNFNFYIPKNEQITLLIFNTIGQEVCTLLNGGEMNAGKHTMRWNALDNSGQRVPSGIYFLHINAGKFDDIKKLNLLK